jgi:hypothetical protein
MCVSQRLELVDLSDGSKICKLCKSWKTNLKDKTNNTLPIWFDKEGISQFELPEELQNLREAEKLPTILKQCAQANHQNGFCL